MNFARAIIFVVWILWPCAASACGNPVPLGWYLSPARCLEMPNASFAYEVHKAFGGPPISWKSRSTANRASGWANTVAADERDLAQALSASNIDSQDAALLVKDFLKLRDAMHKGGSLKRLPPRDIIRFDTTPFKTTIDSLPAEFRHYTLGAIAYYEKRIDAAVEHWLALLSLPEDERRYRTVWSEYMIGRALISTQPEESIRHLHKVQELANAGWHDPLGLAHESEGWIPRAIFNSGDSVLVYWI
jgi:hypothetical protein